MSTVLFITSTDTGAGKTLLTALLLRHLRAQGRHALAMKPFSSGGWHDVEVLGRAQEGEVAPAVISPFHFDEPLAPLIAGRRVRRRVALPAVLEAIRALAGRCELLLVEGIGGVYVPLGPGYSVADVIAALGCPVVLVGRNKLGAVNHTLLTLAALRALAVPSVHVVLMDTARRDLAARTNPALIAELAAPAPVTCIPWLGPNAAAHRALPKHARKLKKSLAQIFGTASFSSASGEPDRKKRSKKFLRKEQGNVE